MNGRRALSNAFTVALVALAVAMVLGQLLGQPVALGYVATDSMEPTLDAGDGFVAVPAFLAGEPEPGDVVVFQARALHGGGLTTHRVVDETENGYVTRGDNNPFTDQDGGEPPVTEGQIVAYALQVDGEVVSIPWLGTAITGVRSAIAAPFGDVGTERVGSVLVFAGIVLFVLAGMAGGERRRTSRRRDREDVVAVWAVVLFAVATVTAAATAAMVLPAGVHEFGVVSTAQPTGEPQVVAPGERATLQYDVHNAGVLPVLVIHEPASGGVAVAPDRTVLGSDDRRTVDVTMRAPDEPGRYLRSVRESRYLLVLPPGVLAGLHAIHPLLALVAVDLVVALFVFSVAIAVFGTGQLRIRSGPDSVPFRVRLRRRVRQWL